MQSKPVPTGRTLALHWHDHSRHFMSHLPHTRLLAVGDVDVQALSRAGCRHLYRADVWFAPLMLAGGNRTVLEQARTAGMTTLLDINWDPAWSGRSTHQIAERKAQVLDVLPFVTWANGNERELCLFSDERDVRAACGKLLERGAAGVVVHRGKLGAAAVTPDEDWLEVPAERVDDVSCAAGAGDVFSAAFMTMEGLPLRERLTACARLVADHLSGRRSLIPRFD